MTSVSGAMLIGAAAVRGPEAAFRGVDPATGAELKPVYGGAGAVALERACALARETFDTFRETGLDRSAGFLEAIAERIIELGRA